MVGSRLDLRVSQSLVMTPQLQQAIKLLQFSNVELTDYVEQELERNPLLERDEGNLPVKEDTKLHDAEHAGQTGDDQQRAVSLNATSDSTSAATSESDGSGTENGSVDSFDLTVQEGAGGLSDSALEYDTSNVYESASIGDLSDYGDAYSGSWDGPSGSFGSEGQDFNYENIVTSKPSLRDVIDEQIRLDIRDPEERAVAYQYLDALDQTGYIRTTPEAIAATVGCAEEVSISVLSKLQGFEPAGLFSRTLSECLTLQLKDRGRLTNRMELILQHLQLIARREIGKLASICKCSEQEILEDITEIRRLDPKPALRFEGEGIETVRPDVLMRKAPSGNWIIEINPDTVPRILVNQNYYQEISRGKNAKRLEKADKDFMAECYNSASWLAKSLHQRTVTILRVTEEIVRQQHAFFEKGVTELKPLVLRDVAAAIEMHESTVSRVTTNKFVATNRGIYELKYFFTSSVGGEYGSQHSAEAVKHHIKQFIDKEVLENVLSDDQLVTLLKEQGIDIARRTVAKYREAMGLPSSVQRRRNLKMRF